MADSTPRAGTAFLRLQAFAKAMQVATDTPEYQAAQAAKRQQWQGLANAIRKAIQACNADLAVRYLPETKTIDDWEHLARIVKFPPDEINELTPARIFNEALAWADRQTIKAKLATTASQDIYRPDAVLEPIRDAIQDVMREASHSKGADDAYTALVAALRDGRRHRPKIVTEAAAGEIDGLASNFRYEPTPEAVKGLQRWQKQLRTATLYGEPAEGASNSTPKRRGRRKADYQTVEREAQLAADWRQARDSGVYKPVFAKQNGMTTAKLDNLLDRVAARKRASD